VGIVGGVGYLAWEAWKLYNEAKKPDDKPENPAEPAGQCPTPEDIQGKSPEEIDKIMKDKGWTSSPTREGDGTGTRYANPDKLGEQVRVMPGKSTDRDPVKRGPYGRISKNGDVSQPIPLK